MRIVLATTLMLGLAACQPQPPEKEQPPVPKAGASATELRDAIQAPIDKAKAAEQAVQDAAAAREAAIESD